MADYELITLIASVLYYKSHSGPMYLVTDRRGLDYLNSLKLTSLYDKIIELHVNKDINPKIFWAAGKIYAHSVVTTPSISIDMDAIIWQPIHKTVKPCDAVALHVEPSDWPPYTKKWDDIQGPWSVVDSRAVEPVNTGVLALLADPLKYQYIEAAESFMVNFSRSNQQGHKAEFSHGPSYVDEMVFAEQMMLSLIAKKLGARIRSISSYDRFSDHMVENRKVTHLWNSKRGYRSHSRAREAYVHDMIDRLLKDFPESRKFIASSHIATMAVRDSNTGAIRYSKPGEWILPGEEVEYYL